MEQKAEARTLVDQGDALLADGHVMEAAAAYAQAVQVEPAAVGGHLGLAEANLALGVYSTVYLACRQVQTLAPDGPDAALARAILFVLERRYDAAIQELDRVAALDPGRAYAHALRGYCLRQLGHTYDAQQATAKARRLSSGKDYTHLFPQVAQSAVMAAAPQWQSAAQVAEPQPPPVRDAAWERQRQAVRARLSSRQGPIVTYTLITINVIVYLLAALSLGGNFMEPLPSDPNAQFNLATVGPFYYYGAQIGALMQHDPTQWYRVLTSMFLHANIAHISLNMLSLYFVGVATEQIFGRWRFAVIYLASGVIAGVTQALLQPGGVAVGASGAIFGIFGAFGAFVILRRHMLGRAASPIIGQWLFWLLLNLVFSFAPGIALYDHVGGLVSGFILGALLIPSFFRTQRLS